MEEEELAGDSLDVWKEGVIEHYEKRPAEMRDVSLAQFAASYYMARDGKYKRRKFDRIIRYRNYDMNTLHEYKRDGIAARTLRK